MIHTGNNGGECLSVESTSGTINQGVRAYLFPALTVVTIEFRPGSTDFLVRLLRLLPAGAKDAGWGSHPLKDGAFARRTGSYPTSSSSISSIPSSARRNIATAACASSAR